MPENQSLEIIESNNEWHPHRCENPWKRNSFQQSEVNYSFKKR